MPRRSGGSRVMSRPPTEMRPALTATKPEIARSSVVLPQPDGPSRATNSPAATASDTFFSTGVAPYATSRSATSRVALAMRDDYSIAVTLLSRLGAYHARGENRRSRPGRGARGLRHRTLRVRADRRPAVRRRVRRAVSAPDGCDRPSEGRLRGASWRLQAGHQRAVRRPDVPEPPAAARRLAPCAHLHPRRQRLDRLPQPEGRRVRTGGAPGQAAPGVLLQQGKSGSPQARARAAAAISREPALAPRRRPLPDAAYRRQQQQSGPHTGGRCRVSRPDGGERGVDARGFRAGEARECRRGGDLHPGQSALRAQLPEGTRERTADRSVAGHAVRLRRFPARARAAGARLWKAGA